MARPTGTVTFLFTDVEGSTRWWVADERGMSASLAVHDAVVRAALEAEGGYVFATAGDSFGAAFSRASDAVAAALNAQCELETVRWPGPALRVRMGLHLGEADERNGDYFGAAVSTAARVAAGGHGGQLLATEAVRMAAHVTAVDLGVHQLRDVAEPLRLYQLGEGGFPALRSLQRSPTNLRVRPTTLIGRDDEVDQARRLLVSHRLVNVTAAGGSGKTRAARSGRVQDRSIRACALLAQGHVAEGEPVIRGQAIEGTISPSEYVPVQRSAHFSVLGTLSVVSQGSPSP